MDLATNGSGDFEVLIDNIQFEDKTYSTPFVDISRPAITSFLIHGNVGSGTTFEDSSSNKITVSNQNSVSHGGKSNFGGSAIKFSSSSSQQLTSASTDVINFGTEDWTIEFWFNMTNGSTARMHALSCGPGSTNNIDFNFNDGNAFWLYWNSGGTPNIIFGNDGDYGDGNWHHLMATRASGIVRVWVDGVHKGANNYSSSTSMGQTASIYVGGKSGVYWDGFLDEIRIIKGTALWSGSGNFSVPTERFKNGAWSDVSGNGNGGNFINGVNTGTSHYRVGHVIYPYGTNSARYLDFDGSDDHVTVSATGTKTVEVWFNPDTTSGTNILYCPHTNGYDNWLSFSTLVGLVGTESADTNNFSIYGGSVSAGNWYQAVAIIDDTTATLYVNGSQVATTTKTFTIGSWSGKATIGRRGALSQSYANAKIGLVKVYNRPLTATEVLQNYNATKGRFGL